MHWSSFIFKIIIFISAQYRKLQLLSMHILCKHKSVFMIMLHLAISLYSVLHVFSVILCFTLISSSVRVISDVIFLVSFLSYTSRQVPSSAYSLLILSHIGKLEDREVLVWPRTTHLMPDFTAMVRFKHLIGSCRPVGSFFLFFNKSASSFTNDNLEVLTAPVKMFLFSA